MRFHKLKSLLTSMLCLTLSVTAACAKSRWGTYIEAGKNSAEQGRYAESEGSWRAALKEAKKYGPEDWRMPRTLNNLALLYTKQHKYAEAAPLYRRALAISEKEKGPDHPDTAQILNNLGGLYCDQAKYVEGERLIEQALAIREYRRSPLWRVTADYQRSRAVAQSLNALTNCYNALYQSLPLPQL